MNITIHRGTNQIGGCVTEIESDGYKVFIDFGEQLPGVSEKELSQIQGLTCGDSSKAALFVTHYHGDHIGSITNAVSDLPIYVGKTALKIYTCLETRLSYIPDVKVAEKHKENVERIKTINLFTALQKIKIGGITVTPISVDHSAFDAYMFIIEADGKRVLHTGDFRGHGFRSKSLIDVLKKYAKNIDYIISEGTNISRPSVAMVTEHDLQSDFEQNFRKYKYNFIFVSSTNIDRVFALYHAAKKAKRCFVCDSYQTQIMKIVTDNHKQYTSFYDVEYDQKVDASGRFIILRRTGTNYHSFEGNLKPYLNKHGFCMLIRSNSTFKPLVDRYVKKEETKIYYSMWKGYLDKTKTAFNQDVYNFFESYDFEYKHTSGHADIETMREVFDTLSPKAIIPIHTEYPEKFKELFPTYNFILLIDGEVCEL